MHAFPRCLALLAIAAHVGLGAADAYARSAATEAFGGATNASYGLIRMAQSSPGNGGGNSGPGPGTGTGGHGAGYTPPPSSAAPASGACAAGLNLPDPNSYADAIEGLQEISKETQAYLTDCNCDTQACVADALDKYADAVAKVAPRLPPALRKLPAVIHAAAQKARVAPTPRAAAKVLIAAVAVVHKTIALMRAADADAKLIATRGGDAVADTLKTAATELARADSL